MPKVFISYSRQNSFIALQLNHELNQAGCVTFFDRQDIKLSQEWLAEIEGAVQECEYFLYLWSPESHASVEVQHEFDLAKKALPKEKIAVIRIAGDAHAMPSEVGKYHHEDFSSVSAYPEAMELLLDYLNAPLRPERDLELMFQQGRPLAELIADVPTMLQRSWVVGSHSFVSFPVAVTAYSICRRVVCTTAPRIMNHDIQVVLQYTGRRNTVELVLEYLLATGKEPCMLYLEGPLDRDSTVHEIPAAPHIWKSCMQFASDCIEKFPMGRRPHLFFDAMNSMAFGIGARLHTRASYVLYNFGNSGDPATRYYEVDQK